MLVQRLIISHLDYYNILFAGIANAFFSVHIRLEHCCQDYFPSLLL